MDPAKSTKFSNHGMHFNYKPTKYNNEVDAKSSGRTTKGDKKFSARSADRKKFKGEAVFYRNSGIDVIDEESAVNIDSAASFRKPTRNTLAKRINSSLHESGLVAEEEKKSSARQPVISPRSHDASASPSAIPEEPRRHTPEI